MKQLVQQQTAIVPYRGAIQPAVVEEEPDTPLWVMFYVNLGQDFDEAYPDWYKYEDADDDNDPYAELRTDEAWEQRRREWELEARRMEAECWQRLGPGPKGWRITNGRYEIGNLEETRLVRQPPAQPLVHVLRPEQVALLTAKKHKKGKKGKKHDALA